MCIRDRSVTTRRAVLVRRAGSLGRVVNLLGERWKAAELKQTLTDRTVSYTHLRAHETRRHL
eukprot:3823975-Prorocentrum_lima.AAC.1